MNQARSVFRVDGEVRTRERRVEDQGIGQDGHADAPRLSGFVVGLPQEVGELASAFGLPGMLLRETLSGLLDALFQSAGKGIDPRRRRRGAVDEQG